MPGSGSGQHDDLAFLPERVARKSFTASFRGFDQLEVKAYLGELATELRSLREREEQLRQELIDARLLAERAQQIDESKLTAILGEETAKVLDTARQAAAQITAKAEERAATMLSEAREEASRVRAGAAEEVDKRVATRERELAAARADVDARRKEIEEQASGEIVAARERGREMVAEAQLVRERVLKDMVRRRRIARQQIEQLRAARDRLLAAYAVVRRTLDEVSDELAAAIPEAKIAAELAGRRFSEANPDEEITLAELEAEVATAREELEALGAPEESDAEVAPGAAAVPEPVAAPAPAPAPAAEPAEAHEAGDAEPAQAAAELDASPQEAAEWFDAAPEPMAEPEPEAVPEPGPMSADGGTVVEERKSSTLRIFRRRPAPEPHPTFVSGPVDPMEAVRIIRSEEEEPVEPEPAPVPEVAAVVEPEPAEPEPAEPVAVEPVAVEPVAVEPVAVEPEPEPEAEPEPESAPVSSRVDELFARMRAERAEAVAKAQEVLAEEAPAEGDEPEPAVEPGATSAAGAAALARRDEVVAPFEQTLTRRLKRVLADEQNEVLDLLRRGPSGKGGDVLPPAADHVARYRDAAADALQDAWRAGAGTSDQPIPADLLTDLATELVEPLRTRVERVVGRSGEGEELADALRGCYREWRGRLSDGAVRHAVIAAYSAGVYDAAAPDTKLCWVVDNGGVPCPDADDNALAGAVPKGEPYPTGHLRPPAHPGCRCLAIPDPD